MKKRKGKYIFRDTEYENFKEMKRAAYFKMSKNEKEKGYYMIEDEILIEYEFDKKERRIICTKMYDYEEMEKINWENKQLNLW